ncbi:MAG: hypothetical protein AAFX81_08180 [Pseudomonadota bacterium]
MDLPVPRDFGWPLKPFESASTAVRTLPTGQMELMIEHDVIRGVTPEMLVWWFTSFAELRVGVAGVDYPAYLVWHPYDHVAVEARKARPSGPVQAGDHLRIMECFARDPRFELDVDALVTRLDPGGIGLRGFAFRRPFLELVHRFEEIGDGTLYRTRMVIGVDSGLLKPLLNGFVVPRKFSEAKAAAWHRHNVEEVGYFENFLPALFARRDEAPRITLDL